ncbi:xanthine dehydrogenase accessory factor [Endobacter medicaginis]|uniref:Xanthine dehydrogenase accessory factor n=2 Tax=Endobacter medicaginis TaxID=1181271 RepID=A0A839UY25_9PROT|nr:xanthine dehydrogenase accessory factor [Endobacter medicaginis]MCX5474649.1 XdhC family protein [Endobacter medicaginis]
MFAASERGAAVALATLVALDGGGPRPPGSQMAITGEGVCGYLSGGCIEADIVGHAASVLETGEPLLLRYGEGGPWFDLKLPCGGGMSVLVERLLPDDPALAVWRGRGREVLCWCSDGRLRRAEAVAAGEAGCAWDGTTVRLSVPPPWRLVVVGHNPGALAIALLGAQTGLQTHLLRESATTTVPGHGIRLHSGRIADSLAALRPDRWTAIAVAGHDEDADRRALAAALPSAASYVGLLGSRRRLVAHRAALIGQYGLSPGQLDRLHAPIGLDLGGKAPWDVALSVIAEIVRHRHRSDGTQAG